jgi:hypothetical protein
MSERLGSWGGEDRALDQAIRNAAVSFLTENPRLRKMTCQRSALRFDTRSFDTN